MSLKSKIIVGALVLVSVILLILVIAQANTKTLVGGMVHNLNEIFAEGITIKNGGVATGTSTTHYGCIRMYDSSGYYTYFKAAAGVISYTTSTSAVLCP